MHRAWIVLLALLLLPLAMAPVRADSEDDSLDVIWVRDLTEAFEIAKAKDKPLMIAINSVQVDGKRREEPAAKELRERTYLDARIVKASKDFICAYLTSGGSSVDFGELRLRYGIDGQIVSPQHIFAYPDGRLIDRHEYWPHGTGDSSVNALLRLMRDALAKDRTRRASATPGDEGAEDTLPEDASAEAPSNEAPPDGEERLAWIAERIAKIQGEGQEARVQALRELIEADKDGDCVRAILAALPEHKKYPSVQTDIVRALGRPGLVIAAEAIEDFLSHKDDALRANAAVSLEYIGAPTSVKALSKRAPREKDEVIANHMYRALGRCGACDAKARKVLVKAAVGGKSEFATYGPIIGLAYSEQDPKTAREVEKLILKTGVSSGRGGFQGATKRALLVWCLTQVGFGDPKSEKFVREKLIPTTTESAWGGAILEFYEAAAACCAGNEEAREQIDQGVSRSLSWRGGRLMDDARKGREDAGFTPKGDNWGGGDGGGAPGGGPGGGPGGRGPGGRGRGGGR